MTAPDSAEEFYARRLENAVTLEHAAQRRAAHGDAVRALALAYGCDLEIVQAYLWETAVVVPGATPRQFFEAAMAAIPPTVPSTASTIPARDCADVLQRTRRDLVARLDPASALDLEERWPELAFLTGLPEPSVEDLQVAVLQRLEGLGPKAFATERRQQARAAMDNAQRARVQGDVGEAIRSAYAADFAVLEAYLVQSAIAAGDEVLFTVITRWELASHSVAGLPGLPADFSGAVSVVRAAMCQPLGDADGSRLADTFLAV